MFQFHIGSIKSPPKRVKIDGLYYNTFPSLLQGKSLEFSKKIWIRRRVSVVQNPLGPDDDFLAGLKVSQILMAWGFGSFALMLSCRNATMVGG